MKLRNYSADDLRRAIASSVSIRQTLQKLGVRAVGGNYATFHKAVRHFGLDTRHFTGQNLSGRKLPLKRKALVEYLVNGSDIQSFRLKRYLLEHGVLDPLCSACGGTSWQGQSMPLELDHVNGNRRDNQLSNLRLLCPNCHALTPTYRSRNRGRYAKSKA